MAEILQKAEEFYQKKQWSKAAELFLEAKNNHEGDYNLYALKLAEALHRSGSSERGAYVLSEWAEELSKNEKDSKAVSVLQKALEFYPEDMRSLKLISSLFEKQDLKTEAKGAYEKLLDLYLKQKHWHHAEPLSKKLKKLGPEEFKIILSRLEVLEGLGNWAEYSSSLVEAFEVFDLTLLEKGAPNESDPVYQKCFQKLASGLIRFPKDPLLMGLQSRLAHLKGNFDEALQIIQKAIKIDSKRLEILQTLTDIFLKLGKKEYAQFVLDTITSQMSDEWLEKKSFVKDLNYLKSQFSSKAHIGKTRIVPLESIFEQEAQTATQGIGTPQEVDLFASDEGSLNVRSDAQSWSGVEDYGDDLLEEPTERISPKATDEYLKSLYSQASFFFDEGHFSDAKKLCVQILSYRNDHKKARELLSKIRNRELINVENRSNLTFLGFQKVFNTAEIKRNLIKDLGLDEVEEEKNEADPKKLKVKDLFFVDFLLDKAINSNDEAEQMDIGVMLHELGFYEEALRIFRMLVEKKKPASSNFEEERRSFLGLMYLIARTYSMMNRPYDALGILEPIVQDRSIEDGDKKPILILASKMLKILGKEDRARELEKRMKN